MAKTIQAAQEMIQLPERLIQRLEDLIQRQVIQESDQALAACRSPLPENG
jgi:hypothetical protein